MQPRNHEQTRMSGVMLPWENLKFKSFEIVKNASKTVNSNVNFLNYYSHLNKELQPGPHV